jgi:hypothetical protein
MARQLRRSLTFANVCSFIALVFALGTRGAYAANTIGSDDVAIGAIDSNSVLDESLTSSDLATDSVGSAEIAGGSIAAAR